jgi:hypothetical protein
MSHTFWLIKIIWGRLLWFNKWHCQGLHQITCSQQDKICRVYILCVCVCVCVCVLRACIWYMFHCNYCRYLSLLWLCIIYWQCHLLTHKCLPDDDLYWSKHAGDLLNDITNWHVHGNGIFFHMQQVTFARCPHPRETEFHLHQMYTE